MILSIEKLTKLQEILGDLDKKKKFSSVSGYLQPRLGLLRFKKKKFPLRRGPDLLYILNFKQSLNNSPKISSVKTYSYL